MSLPPSTPSPSRPQRKHQAGMRMLTTGWWVFRSAAFQNEASLTSERGKRAQSIEFLDNFVLREMGSDVRLTYKETLRGQPRRVPSVRSTALAIMSTGPATETGGAGGLV